VSAVEPLFPAFLKLKGRRVVVVGAGPVAASKLAPLLAAGADIHVIAPTVVDAIRSAKVTLVERAFRPGDLEGAWFVVAAAPPEVNRQVAQEAEARCVFVNAVDDKENASAYLGGVVRKAGVTVSISTDGRAPAIAGLLREGLDALLPDELDAWMKLAESLRTAWKAARVPMEQRRPLLLDALVSLHAGGPARSAGFVSLVGAGPGDPELLTRKAARRLHESDVVLFDALTSPALRALAPRATWIDVGKRGGKKSARQEAIERLMVWKARRGLRVVRLKAGDPFVLGRGGEEALALVQAGVDFEVIPGLSTSIAGPGLAGIPVTHRGLATSFVMVSGHAESGYAPVLESLAPASATVVVLMGLGRREKIASLLLARGWSADTPAALVTDASHPTESRWLGTLGTLGAAPVPDRREDPTGLLVIGTVVALAGTISRDFPGVSSHATPARSTP